MSDFITLEKIAINEKSDLVLSTFNDRNSGEKKFYLNTQFKKADGSVGYNKGLTLTKNILPQIVKALSAIQNG